VASGIAHRFAPCHLFPTAHDNVRDVVGWISQHAEEMWGADATRITANGFSAGENLAMDLRLGEVIRARLKLPVVEGYIGFYAPIDLRLPPGEKPAPARFPKRDPRSFLLPFIHAYGASAFAIDPLTKRANQCFRHEASDLSTLPKNIFFADAGIDILLKEHLDYFQALRSNIILAKGRGREIFHVESEVYDDGFHWWAELPDCLLRNPKLKVAKQQALAIALDFLGDTMRQSRDQAM
jgi:acetyl esterase/lipase